MPAIDKIFDDNSLVFLLKFVFSLTIDNTCTFSWEFSLLIVSQSRFIFIGNVFMAVRCRSTARRLWFFSLIESHVICRFVVQNFSALQSSRLTNLLIDCESTKSTQHNIEQLSQISSDLFSVFRIFLTVWSTARLWTEWKRKLKNIIVLHLCFPRHFYLTLSQWNLFIGILLRMKWIWRLFWQMF